MSSKRKYILSLACIDRCYYFTGELKSMFKPVNYYGPREYVVILLPMGKVLLEKAINVLYSNQSLVYQIFGVKTYNKFHIENIFLQLLVNRILDFVVEEVSDDTNE